MAARVPDQSYAMGTSASARANSQRGTWIATASKAALVPAAIQEVSSPEKNSGAIDWDWCAAGACEDAEALLVVLNSVEVQIAPPRFRER